MAEVAMQELEKKAAVYMLSRDDAIEASSLQLEQSSWSSSRWTLPQHSATELCWAERLWPDRCTIFAQDARTPGRAP